MEHFSALKKSANIQQQNPVDETKGKYRQKTADRISAETGVASSTIRAAAQYANAVDALAADSPTIKRRKQCVQSEPISAPGPPLMG